MNQFDHGVDNFLYWIIWGSMLIFSKVAGFFSFAVAVMPEIELPAHEIKYLPELPEIMPALIIAGACAFVSAIIKILVDLAWRKFSSKKRSDV
jgi:hypothetical protein